MLSQGLEQVEVRERAGHSVPDVLVATCGAEIGRPKVSQVWSAAIRHSERSASTKGPCLPRFRLQMVWKDSMKERGGEEPAVDVSVSSASSRLLRTRGAPPHDGGGPLGQATFGQREAARRRR